jgi:hypothetical protein
MPIRYHEVLKVSEQSLENAEVFNGFVDIDSKFYVDPHLLQSTTIPELSTANQTFTNHFLKILTLLQASAKIGDRFYNEAHELLIFPEKKWVGLGYSTTADGSGIGPELARKLTDTANDIIKAGIKDVEIFELVGLIEENIGPDRISDMTISIIFRELLLYSQRVTSDLKLSKTEIKHQNEIYNIPAWSDRGELKPMILIPKQIIDTLPAAFSWDDFDIICAQNEEARQRVNNKIGNTWKHATSSRNILKTELKKVLIEESDALKDLIQQYKNKPAISYDFVNDPELELIWHKYSIGFSQRFPLDLLSFKGNESGKILNIVREICVRYKQLIEYNGLNELLYNDDGTPRKERIAQKVFLGIADVYCRDNDLDLSPEVNSGRGSVDFKISKGYTQRVCVELKLASNRIDHGFEKQIAEYKKSENVLHVFYAVIKTIDSKSQNEKISALLNKRKRMIDDGERPSEIFIIDATAKPSASHM